MNFWDVAPNDAFDPLKSPRTGLDFKLWNQVEIRDDKTCSGGVYNEKAKTCFKYHVLKAICVVAKFRPMVPLVAVTNIKDVQTSMTLQRGVITYVCDESVETVDDQIKFGIAEAKKNEVTTSGAKIICVTA